MVPPGLCLARLPPPVVLEPITRYRRRRALIGQVQVIDPPLEPGKQKPLKCMDGERRIRWFPSRKKMVESWMQENRKHGVP